MDWFGCIMQHSSSSTSVVVVNPCSHVPDRPPPFDNHPAERQSRFSVQLDGLKPSLLPYLLCPALSSQSAENSAYKTAYLNLVFRIASYPVLSPSDWKTRESRLFPQRPCAGRDQFFTCASVKDEAKEKGAKKSSFSS